MDLGGADVGKGRHLHGLPIEAAVRPFHLRHCLGDAFLLLQKELTTEIRTFEACEVAHGAHGDQSPGALPQRGAGIFRRFSVLPAKVHQIHGACNRRVPLLRDFSCTSHVQQLLLHLFNICESCNHCPSSCFFRSRADRRQQKARNGLSCLSDFIGVFPPVIQEAHLLQGERTFCCDVQGCEESLHMSLKAVDLASGPELLEGQAVGPIAIEHAEGSLRGSELINRPYPELHQAVMAVLIPFLQGKVPREMLV
mmetsp:Transcript_669/g.1784  ORF Transcript_669/g.1784 Transcript_669/m.1784 type:complete len:253 (+) Transcript_669:434-1192(+)